MLAALLGLGLLADSTLRSSATYDEVAYLRVAARWWRTGDQTPITRMGSPLTFWKIQQVPVLWALDRGGFRALVDEPEVHQRALLPLVRLGSLWIWLVALLLTAAWSRALYGPRAMAFAAWLFALSPNVLAHGALVTMELPLVASLTGVFFLFWHFLGTGRPVFFWASAALAGLAWSCKFTTVVVPPILAAIWLFECARSAERRWLRTPARAALGILTFVAVILAVDVAITGFALLPLSDAAGEHPSLGNRFGPTMRRWVGRALELPIPRDWVGFITQMKHQREGGWSYLFGERRMSGWRYYYLVALAVKVPLSFWFLFAGRAALRRAARRDAMLPLTIGLFLAITALGSSRNYGVRYLLPLAPLAIVWVSALAEGSRRWRILACTGLVGQAVAVAAIHPYELTYFNIAAGGPRGGRRILADSNLDWGQGLKALAMLQQQRPELTDLTFYYFGDTDPKHYGVAGTRYVINAATDHPGLPAKLEVRTAYLAVSTSLQWGPWGPAGYFHSLRDVQPVHETADHTIRIYRAADLPR